MRVSEYRKFEVNERSSINCAPPDIRIHSYGLIDTPPPAHSFFIACTIGVYCLEIAQPEVVCPETIAAKIVHSIRQY